ncbi:RNA-binding S4 domain-containing protein OS=Streptomyces glaucescens OX=1907 GN=SGLAU_09000 PE=4 SV=1 [Streptomyces glaucescens]|jgi:ribosome-associated heat shock protein Hsp15
MASERTDRNRGDSHSGNRTDGPDGPALADPRQAQASASTVRARPAADAPDTAAAPAAGAPAPVTPPAGDDDGTRSPDARADGDGRTADAQDPAADPKVAAAIAAAEAAAPANGETVRIDSWIWAVRLIKTRSLGAAACKGGHVRVNGERVKPAHAVRIGDEVRLRQEGRERIVVVKRLIRKRVGAPVAVQCYIDNSPPPPPREAVAPAGVRDRGAGRPTKRDRRELERLRGLKGFGFGGHATPGGRPAER